MRVLQLIDSLEAGGAERVAVNIANALSFKIEASFLCATRKEGLLKNSLNKSVNYLFLNKKRAIDLMAIMRLHKFVKKHRINIIHAHSSSFFLATLVKMLNSKVRIIWHDHYGNSEFLDRRKLKVLTYASKYFSHILCVNKILEEWAKKKLKSKQVNYFPNFAIQDNIKAQTKLFGVKGKRIVHLANLRKQKDHQTLIKAFENVMKNHPDWTLHCIGKDFNDDYSKLIKKKIKDLENVFFYGSKLDITNILNQSDIAVLSSKSEGLPLALLEYGLAGLATITTNVGECGEVISEKEGVLISSQNSKLLTKSINSYIDDFELRKTNGRNLEVKVLKMFSEKALINNLINIYNLNT